MFALVSSTLSLRHFELMSEPDTIFEECMLDRPHHDKKDGLIPARDAILASWKAALAEIAEGRKGEVDLNRPATDAYPRARLCARQQRIAINATAIVGLLRNVPDPFCPSSVV
jgi:hypothetical protein